MRAQGQSVTIGEHEIEQHHIDLIGERLARLQAAIGSGDAKTMPDEDVPKRVRNSVVVLDDENLHSTEPNTRLTLS